MDASPEAGDMGMPPQRAFLPGYGEPVGEAVVWADGALGDHRHPVGPAVHPLLHAMPAENTCIYIRYVLFLQSFMTSCMRKKKTAARIRRFMPFFSSLSC